MLNHLNDKFAVLIFFLFIIKQQEITQEALMFKTEYKLASKQYFW